MLARATAKGWQTWPDSAVVSRIFLKPGSEKGGRERARAEQGRAARSACNQQERLRCCRPWQQFRQTTRVVPPAVAVAVLTVTSVVLASIVRHLCRRCRGPSSRRGRSRPRRSHSSRGRGRCRPRSSRRSSCSRLGSSGTASTAGAASATLPATAPAALHGSVLHDRMKAAGCEQTGVLAGSEEALMTNKRPQA